jgi:hypothetical protein
MNEVMSKEIIDSRIHIQFCKDTIMNEWLVSKIKQRQVNENGLSHICNFREYNTTY